MPPLADVGKLVHPLAVGQEERSMKDEDLEPRIQKADVKNLAVLSVEALENYIVELQAEIERVRAEIASKKAARSAADSVFRR